MIKPRVSNQKQQALRVSVLGMDERARKTLAMAFNGPGKQKYQIADDQAAVTIIDMDTVGADKLLQQNRQQFQHQPLIIISVKERNMANVGWIKKPVKITVLFRLLDDLKKKIDAGSTVGAEFPVTRQAGHIRVMSEEATLVNVPTPVAKVVAFPDNKKQQEDALNKKEQAITHHQVDDFEDMAEDQSQIFCGKSGDVDLSDTDQRKKIYYSPERYFQGILNKAIDVASSSGKAITIEGIQKPLTVLPDRLGLLTTIDDRFLRALCYSPAIQSAVSFDPIEIDIEKARTSENFIELNNFIWKTCLLSAQGRIPVDVNVSAPVHMRFWPNFTRLLLTPHAMRISSLWAEGPQSLITTARMLGIDQRFVFSLFSAARELGYVEITSLAADNWVTDNAVADTVANKVVKAHKRRGLLGRILHHLGAV